MDETVVNKRVRGQAMLDLSVGQVLMLATGVVLVVASLCGLIPMLMQTRAAAGAGKRRADKSAPLEAQAGEKTPADGSGAAPLPAAAEAIPSSGEESERRLIEELFTQMLCLRDELSSVATDVRSLRAAIETDRGPAPIPLRQAPAKEPKTRRRAA